MRISLNWPRQLNRDWVVAAEGEGFSCKVFPLVTYEGHERARMLHFVFQLDPASSLRGFSKQSTRDILQLPTLEAVSGRWPSTGHP